MHRLLITSLYLLTCVAAFSQIDRGVPVQPPSIPESQLVFEPPQRTPLGALGTAMSANYVCADDGSIFVQIADTSRTMNLVLHSLQGTSSDIRFDAPYVPGYGPIGAWALNYFVNDRQVATLVQTTIEQNQFEKQEGPPTWVSLALLYHRNGQFERAVPIPPEINPKALGIYGSGDLLVIGADKTTKAAELFVLSPKGDVVNHLLLFDEDYNTSKTAKKKQPLAEIDPDGALTFMQVVANGSNLLLIPQTTSAPVIEINEHGIVRTVELKLPEGIVLQSLLSQNSYVWKVRTSSNIEITADAKTGEKSASLRDGPVLEFNSFDGSLLRKINLPAKMNGFIACEHNGDYTALTTDPKDGRLELVKGAEVKQ